MADLVFCQEGRKIPRRSCLCEVKGKVRVFCVRVDRYADVCQVKSERTSPSGRSRRPLVLRIRRCFSRKKKYKKCSV